MTNSNLQINTVAGEGELVFANRRYGCARSTPVQGCNARNGSVSSLPIGSADSADAERNAPRVSTRPNVTWFRGSMHEMVWRILSPSTPPAPPTRRSRNASQRLDEAQRIRYQPGLLLAPVHRCCRAIFSDDGEHQFAATAGLPPGRGRRDTQTFHFRACQAGAGFSCSRDGIP